MSEEPWLMRVEKGLSAHFKQENGPNRPGVMWAVQLKRGDALHTAMVKVLFATDSSSEVRSDKEGQAQAAMQYLNAQLANGWDPSKELEHTIVLGTATTTTVAKKQKPWWRIW
jgi:hypothetical protein